MKSYPSISTDFQEFDAYVFDKVDGSNLRFEWSRKRGWYKYGTRHRMFDHTDPDFGQAIPIFQKTLADPVAKIAKEERWESVVVFAEFWGPNSFAGVHDTGDEKRLTLFDVSPHKKGILGPRDFRKMFGHLDTPKFLGIQRWTRGFVDRVRKGEFEGVTFEGVVGKGGSGHELVMKKAKTQAWVTKVLERYGAEKGKEIVES